MTQISSKSIVNLCYGSKVFFFLVEWKKGVFRMSSSSPRHVMAMNNITCTTRVLLGLSLELLLSECKTGTLITKSHPPCGNLCDLLFSDVWSEISLSCFTMFVHPFQQNFKWKFESKQTFWLYKVQVVISLFWSHNIRSMNLWIATLSF